jgi:hypothetical protein
MHTILGELVEKSRKIDGSEFILYRTDNGLIEDIMYGLNERLWWLSKRFL